MRKSHLEYLRNRKKVGESISRRLSFAIARWRVLSRKTDGV